MKIRCMLGMPIVLIAGVALGDEPTAGDFSGGLPPGPRITDVRVVAVGPKITAKARIPFQAIVHDDAGVAGVYLDFRLLRAGKRIDDAAWRRQALRNPPKRGVRLFALHENGDTLFERFDVRPHLPTIGDRLQMTVVAEGVSEGEPRVTRSRVFEFEIVSEADLQASFYDSTWSQLQKLKLTEQSAYVATSLVRVPVLDVRDVADARARIASDRDRLDRAAVYFGTQMSELEFNGGDPRLVRQMMSKVVEPLTDLDAVFAEFDQHLAKLGNAVRDDGDANAPIEGCRRCVQDLASGLTPVEKELEEHTSYLKAVRELRAILAAEERARERAKPRSPNPGSNR